MVGGAKGKNKTTALQEKDKKHQVIPDYSSKAPKKDVKGANKDPEQLQTQYDRILPVKSKSRSEQRDNVKAKIVALEKERAHKVKMEDLLGFCEMDIGEVFAPECKLEYKISEQQIKKMEKDFLGAFACFLENWRKYIGFEKLESTDKLKISNFPSLCEEILDLFEEFFPFPKKYRLFAKELAEAIYEDRKKVKSGENIFCEMFVVFSNIMFLVKEPEYDIFNENSKSAKEQPFGITHLLRNEKLKKAINYPSNFRAKCKKIVSGIKKQDTQDNPKSIKDKLEKFVNSALNKSSNPEEELFVERMTKVIKELTFEGSEEIKELSSSIEKEIKKRLIYDGLLDICGVHINGYLLPKKDVKDASKFLGLTSKNTNTVCLGEVVSAEQFSSSRVKRELVAMAMTAGSGASVEDMSGLSSFFGQLTKEERFELMHSDIEWRGKSSPLLLVLLLNPETKNVGNIVKDFIPEFLDIKFNIEGEEKDYNITEFLEKLKSFCMEQLGDQDMEKKEESSDKSGEVRSFYEDSSEVFLRNLIDKLEEIEKGQTLQSEQKESEQKEVKSKSKQKENKPKEIKLKLEQKESESKKVKSKSEQKENKPKEAQKVQPKPEKSPSTEIEIDKKKYKNSGCCIVNFLRCLAARVR